MIIQVTQSDISKGEQHNCNECPVALAIKRVVKDTIDVMVGIGIINLVLDDFIVATFDTPNHVGWFIWSFDFHNLGSPISFELPIAQEYLR